MPLIDETMNWISNAKIFTKLDIRQTFHKIRIDPKCEELTTFRTRYRAYKYKVLPFRLSGGPAFFQRFINEVLFPYLDKFCITYIDNIMIYSQSVEEHQEHVKTILIALRTAGLQADIKKYEFGVTRTKFLGFIIITKRIEVDPEKIAAIQY